jgi:hypothetical protein
MEANIENRKDVMKTLHHRHRFYSFGRILAALLLVVGALGWVSKASAAAMTGYQREEIPFENLIVPNFCTGENISETGTIDTFIKATLKPSGALTVQFKYRFKAVGVGDLGNKYIINQESRVKEITGSQLRDDFTFVDKFVQISRGPGDNTAVFFTYRFVFDNKGDLHMEVLDVKFDCHG